ncbi:winged helix DNA-binding protein [Conexibacter sp. W3-3-2]|nr:winged helix DNA-binding protein [Conexibacter sp. W3-3-2]
MTHDAFGLPRRYGITSQVRGLMRPLAISRSAATQSERSAGRPVFVRCMCCESQRITGSRMTAATSMFGSRPSRAGACEVCATWCRARTIFGLRSVYRRTLAQTSSLISAAVLCSPAAMSSPMTSSSMRWRNSSCRAGLLSRPGPRLGPWLRLMLVTVGSSWSGEAPGKGRREYVCNCHTWVQRFVRCVMTQREDDAIDELLEIARKARTAFPRTAAGQPSALTMQVLLAVVRRGPVTATDLVDTLAIDRTSVVHCVRDLRAGELIADAETAGGRERPVLATARGRAVAKDYARAAKRRLAEDVA